jgi:iron complex outermembrane receptor protein
MAACERTPAPIWSGVSVEQTIIAMNTALHRSTQRPVIGILMLFLISLLAMAPSHSAPAPQFQFQIRDQLGLSKALIQFSHQSGLAIVFPDHLTRNIKITGFSGAMDVDTALKNLLGNTDLDYRLVDERIIAVYDARCELTDSCPDEAQLLVRNPLYVPGIEELYVYGSQVTGSRIKRDHLQGSAPVDMISAPDIELSGAQTLGQLLRRLPAVSGNPTSTAISNGGNGTATATLRGLPASSTLVLINGRRVANDGLGGESVDLNSIAPAAVERIEVLKDGASAIYGSDAIAGIVNVILKRDFYGAMLEQYYGTSEQGDGEAVTTTFQYGTGFRNGSFFMTASYFSEGEIHSRERSISASADGRSRGGSDRRSSATPAARVTRADGSVVTRDTTTGAYRDANGEDLFNYPLYTSSLVPSERKYVYATGSYDFSESLTGTLEGSYTETRSQANLAPTPVFTGFEQIPLSVAADNIHNPFGETITDLRRRFTELGARRQDNNTEVERLAAVLQGLHGGWDWELSYSWSKSKARELSRGLVNAKNLQRGIGPAAGCQGAAVDACVPINLFGAPGSIDAQQLEFLDVTGKVIGESSLGSLSFTAARKLGELPHGAIDFALGMEYRDETTSKKPDTLIANMGTIGTDNLAPTHGSRNVTEIYGESITPVWRSADQQVKLDFEVAVRYSRYSDFGDITNPKYGLRFQLSPALLFRATHAQGFRAPSLLELYQGATEAHAMLFDPCILPENAGTLPGCAQQADPGRYQYLTITSGNPRLNPEKSRSYGVGVVWTPGNAPGFSATADYFDIETSQVVDSSAQFILSQNAQFGEFEDRVVRDQRGNLQQVSAIKVNVGERRVQGIDFGLNYRLPKRDWGQLSTGLSLAYMDEYTLQLDNDAPTINLSGSFRDPQAEGAGALPKWKGNFGVQWARQRWRGSYDLHFVSGLKEVVPNTTSNRLIRNWLVHDVQFSYLFTVLNGLRMAMGVDNLLDSDPPFAASAFNDNFDGRTHDIRGRYWYAKLSQRF